jgi:hypothetical protein
VKSHISSRSVQSSSLVQAAPLSFRNQWVRGRRARGGGWKHAAATGVVSWVGEGVKCAANTAGLGGGKQGTAVL